MITASLMSLNMSLNEDRNWKLALTLKTVFPSIFPVKIIVKNIGLGMVIMGTKNDRTFTGDWLLVDSYLSLCYHNDNGGNPKGKSPLSLANICTVAVTAVSRPF